MIARIKSKQNSQQSKVEKTAPKKEEIPAPIEEEDEFVEEDEEMPTEEKKQSVKPQEQATEGRKEAQQIMLLQDNGIYRVQMLNQLQEINKALVVIASVLADLSNGKGTA